MFNKILIANRGEIACRIIETARKWGVRTVAVYSDADAQARHVRMADEAVRIGPAPSAESYLKGDLILNVARDTGAQAIHPGYGFLSENADFAEACEKAGVVFIGPPASAIRAMGLKDAAKQLMRKAGVPVTPGYDGDNQDADHLQAQADEIGYPVLIKAVAGGGGKGMRKVDRAEDFPEALKAAQREGQASFSDPRVLVEKYIENPRHIEVQVFADSQGNCVYLHERDCSLQRRHQKVIEEAPAPGMSPQVRAAIGQAAVNAAKAVNYVGAGTIEFIADGSGALSADKIWFMEMNTRLQVEHPVTEAITGQDLVEWQLRVAAGQPLPLQQAQIPLNGHALEARLYAENPETGFLPSTGPLEVLRFPSGVRIDTGVEEGDVVSPHYDPMVAKVIAWAPTRQQAIAQLSEALGQTAVAGVRANTAFLKRCLDHPDFQDAKLDTGFIGQHLDQLVPDAAPTPQVLALALAAHLPSNADAAGEDPWDRLTGLRVVGQPHVQASFQIRDQIFTPRLKGRDFVLPESAHDLVIRQGGTQPDMVLDGVHLTARCVTGPGFCHLFHQGQWWPLTRPAYEAGADGAGNGKIVSPMPGRILSVSVKVGDEVASGAPLVTLEAMKMEHVLTAPFAAKVTGVAVSDGGQTQEGVELVTLSPLEDEASA